MKLTVLRRQTLALATAFLLISTPLVARADNTVPDGDNLTPVAANALNLGNVCVGVPTSKNVLVAVSRNGNTNNVFMNGATVTVTVQEITGAGLSASVAAPGTLTIPTNWSDADNNTMSPAVSSTVSLTTNTLGAFSGTVKFRSTGKEATTGNPVINRDGTLSVTGTVVNCNTAPSISVDDVTLEGDTFGGRTLALSDIGSASDSEDAPTLPSVTCTPALGSVLPLGATTVSCTATDSNLLTSTDSGTVTVVDTTAPAITGTPASATVEATSPAGATHSYTAPTASDVVWGSVEVGCAPASGSTFPIGSTTVTCTATDGSGNSGSSSFAVNVQDTTAPAFTQPGDVTEEATSAGGAIVSFPTPVATDLLDGQIDGVCSPASGSLFPLGDTTVECGATDAAGNTGTTSFVVTVEDTTAPVLSVPDDITVEATSPAGAVVTFAASAVDAVDPSPVVTCTPPSGSLFTLGTHSVSCTATDQVGNTSEPSTFAVTVQDTTAPTLVGMPSDATVEGNTVGGANWAYTPPTATDVVDPNPTVECIPGQSAFYELGEITVTCTATDTSGNKASDSFTVTVVDTTDPVITHVSTVPAANGNGWNNSAVTVTWACTDIVGVVDATVTAGLTDEGENQSATGTCEDTSGNTASDTQSGIDIDLTAPGIAWNGGPADGGTYYFGYVPAAGTCTATDALSGPDGCAITGYSTAVGSHTLTATATDKAGNEATQTLSYTVATWTLKGFYQPVDMNGTWNTVKGGSTVPLKFEVFAGPTELTDTAVVEAFTVKGVACPATGVTTDDIELVTTGGTSLRYDTTGGQFIQNWQTPKKPGVCYQVTMKTDDGSFITANFKLK